MNLSRAPTLLFVGTTLGFALACAGEPGEAVVDVDDCAGDADVEDTTYIAWELKESAHEMITCGSLTFQFLWALLETADTLLTDPAGVPGAFSYAEGVYTTTGEGVAMDLTPLYGPDSPGGQSGEPVGADLFDPESYLVGADAQEESDGSLTVSFSEPGPLAALLGAGSDPQSPLTLTADDLAEFTENLAGLKVQATIQVDDERIFSTITYDINNPAAFVGDMLAGMRMDMDVVSGASGERPDLGQSLTTPAWDVEYGDAAGTLDGTIEAEVRGGPFDFTVLYEYLPIDPEPAVTITCLE